MGNSFEHATFPEEGMGKPWPRTSPRRFIIAIDLGATYSAVTAAYLNPGAFLFALFDPTLTDML